MSALPPDARPETVLAQALGIIEDAHHGVVPAIYPATTYVKDADAQGRGGRSYARPGNPTYEPCEAVINALEGGAGCRLFASGMAAASAVLSTLDAGERVILPRVSYHGVREWANVHGRRFGIEVEFVGAGDLEALGAALARKRTALVWLETPANPTWDVTDIAAAVDLAHAAGARVCVDNTVATPLLTRPLALGADLVVHSATKYLNGHSDVIAGAVVTARDDPAWARIGSLRHLGGGIAGPFEAWLLLRGLRTLALRVRTSCANALAIARHFDGHPALRAVLYPGLPGHPGHAVAARQMNGGFGGMLSLRIRGDAAAALAVAARLRVFKRATSLGGVESLVEHRKSIEPPDSLVPEDLLRLSVGIEHVDDLIADLERALGAEVAA